MPGYAGSRLPLKRNYRVLVNGDLRCQTKSPPDLTMNTVWAYKQNGADVQGIVRRRRAKPSSLKCRICLFTQRGRDAAELSHTGHQRGRFVRVELVGDKYPFGILVYSNSCNSSLPLDMAWSGCIRSSAWMPVFSSTLTRCMPDSCNASAW